jgi:DNA-binding transcriptional regulator LsrR (DeoR family)
MEERGHLPIPPSPSSSPERRSRVPPLRARHGTDLDLDRLLVKVARLYHESGLTQVQIAGRLRLSRQKIQRLLDAALEKGIVRVVIEPLMGVHDDLEREMESRFGLQEAVVVETSDYDDQAAVAREVGVGAAEYLLRVVRPKDRIVVSWGGTVLAMVNALAGHPHRDMRDVVVVQGLGAVVDPSRDVHSTELARRLAHFLGGQPVILPAPGVAGSRATARAFLSDPPVARALEQARGADIAFASIGAPRQDSILIREGSIVSWKELEALMAEGAVGDINLRYFNARGQAVTSALDQRTIGLSLEEFRNIRRVVGVAGGAAKLAAIRGALAGKLVDVLVTDHRTAERLLEEPREKSKGGKRG